MFCFYKVLLIHEEREKQLSKEQTFILQEPHCLLQQQQQQFTYIILVTPKMYSQLTKFPATKKKTLNEYSKPKHRNVNSLKFIEICFRLYKAVKDISTN